MRNDPNRHEADRYEPSRYERETRYDPANTRYDPYRYDGHRYESEDESGGSGTAWKAMAAAALAAVAGYALYRSAAGTKHDRQGRSRWRGIHVEESVTIHKPASELYRHWRDLENLAGIMSHVRKVEDLGDGRSRWTADAPAGRQVAWDAELIQDLENERLTWRSVPGADVPNEGSVSFRERSGGRGTEVSVTLMYHPPGGAIGSGLAMLFGQEPSQQVKEDLRVFKQKMEGGAVMGDAHKQPSARTSGNA